MRWLRWATQSKSDSSVKRFDQPIEHHHDDRQFLIIGMGRFGSSLTEALLAQNHDVLAVERDYRRVQELASTIPHIVQADATNVEALRQIGVETFGTAVVCIGTNFEANVLTAVQLRKLGVGRVITKANTVTQREILLQIGVDEVILPETEAAVRLAQRLSTVNFVDYLALDPNVGIIELLVPDRLQGRTLAELDLRNSHGLIVLAIYRGEQLMISPASDERISEGDKLLVFGKAADAHAWSE